MNSLTPFDFDGNRLRVQLDEHGDPWFAAVDVCRCLEHTNPTMAIRALADDEKGLREVETRGGPQQLWTVTEAGLYKLVLRSNCPKAKGFQRWVTHEVLPSIRKTGSYGTIKINVRDAAQLAPIALQLIEYTHELRGALAEAGPKVEGYDRLIDADGLKGLQQAGKALGMRPNSFIQLLVANGYLFRREGCLVPYQRHIDAGYLRVRNRVVGNVARLQTFITPKGFDYFWRRFGGDHLELN